MKEEIVQGQPAEEGPRSFVVFLRDLAQGETEALAAHELHELLKRLDEEAHTRNARVKGKLNLKLSFTVDENGVVAVAYDIETKAPPRKTTSSVYWMSKGSNLVAENPRQQKLALRDVSGSRETRTVAAAPAAPAREA